MRPPQWVCLLFLFYFCSSKFIDHSTHRIRSSRLSGCSNILLGSYITKGTRKRVRTSRRNLQMLYFFDQFSGCHEFADARSIVYIMQHRVCRRCTSLTGLLYAFPCIRTHTRTHFVYSAKLNFLNLYYYIYILFLAKPFRCALHTHTHAPHTSHSTSVFSRKFRIEDERKKSETDKRGSKEK